MRRFIRNLHRWLSPVFVIGLLLSLLLASVGVQEDSPLFIGLGVVVVGSIFTLIATGTVMFIQYYWRRGHRAARTRRDVPA